MFIKFILYNPLLKKCLYDKHTRYSLAMCNFDGWNLCGCAIFFWWVKHFLPFNGVLFQTKHFFETVSHHFQKTCITFKKRATETFILWVIFPSNEMRCISEGKRKDFSEKNTFFFLSTGSLLYALYFKYNIAVSFFFNKHIISSNRCMFRYRIIIRLQSFV